MDLCPRSIAQWRMKAKFRELDQRLDGRLRLGDICPVDLRWGAEAQAAAFCPDAPLSMQTVAKGKAEPIEFHTRVEAVFERLHNALPHKRLGPLRPNVHDDGQQSKASKQAAGQPKQPTMSAPE